jgi:bifunctional N-acetylglucosamine-1-phosphate-uridyltransferase/glucosamine-1-phosphate-acetyltransferase GlmU-like protein
MTILTATPETPIGYGRMIRSWRQPVAVEAIVEQKSLSSGAGSDSRDQHRNLCLSDRAAAPSI